jgi:hypothetical protein
MLALPPGVVLAGAFARTFIAVDAFADTVVVALGFVVTVGFVDSTI